jgi:hypothetical protein
MRLWAGFLPTAAEPFQQVVGFAATWNGLLTIN